MWVEGQWRRSVIVVPEEDTDAFVDDALAVCRITGVATATLVTACCRSRALRRLACSGTGGEWISGEVLMLASLLVVAYALFVLLFFRRGLGWRGAGLAAAVVWGLAVALVTEALSFFELLAAPTLAVAWFLVSTAAALYLLRDNRRTPGSTPSHILQSKWAGSDCATVGFGVVVALVTILTGVVALVCPPNTTDSMVYHLPRVVFWIQNQSVSFYPTPELRQLQMPPWSEYAMLHWYALAGGDRFVNVVQWFSILGSATVVSLIAQLLGASRYGQVFSALLCATIPQVVLQASGAKNDCVVAFWLAAMAYYSLAFRNSKTVGNALAFGSAFGLACLTKTTALLIAPPLLAAILLLNGWVELRKYWRLLCLAATLWAAINSVHFARNYRLFGSPLGPSSYIINESTGIGVTASNIARNLALHVGTPVPAFNDAIHRAITKFVNAIGEDVNNPRTTWMGTRFEPPRLSRHEATAGNPLHALALILSLGLLLRHGRRCRELRSSLFLAIGLTLAFFMFCAVLKWQPWHSRLHAPLFVIGSAVTATVLERSWPRSVSVALGVALFVFAVSMVLTNQLRPLVGPYSIFDMSRQDLYFSDRRDLMHAYVSAVKHIDTLGCEVVGLDTSAEDFPYPLLALLKSPQRVFRNVNVTNGSKMYSHSEEDKLPCAVLCPKCLGTPAFDALAPRFSSIRMFDHVVVLAGTPESANHTCAISFRSWYGRESGL